MTALMVTPPRDPAPSVRLDGYVRVPPGRRHIWVPTGSRRSVAAGLTLNTPSRPRSARGVALLWAVTRLLGPRLLSGAKQTWSPPVTPARWSDLLACWSRDIGPFDEVAIYERPQGSRTGCALLLLERGRPRALVRLGCNGESMQREGAIAERMRSVSGSPVRVPSVLASGDLGTWHWIAFEPFPARPSASPARPPLAEISDAIGRGLADLARPMDTPDHWVPIHGDLSPWNLRLVKGQLWLIDWEDARWGPPGADAAYFLACRWWSRRRPSVSPEVAAFWHETIIERGGDADVDPPLQRRLLEVFGG